MRERERGCENKNNEENEARQRHVEKKEDDDGRFKGWIWNGEIVVLGEIRNEYKRKRGAKSHMGRSEKVSWKFLGKYLLCNLQIPEYISTEIFRCNSKLWTISEMKFKTV